VATPERKSNRGYNMALPNAEVMPGGGGGRHLTCGLGVFFAECAVKQGLGLHDHERGASSRASGGRADDKGCPRNVERPLMRWGKTAVARHGSSSIGPRAGESFGIRHPERARACGGTGSRGCGRGSCYLKSCRSC
jgi:hypothetical protein